VTSQPSHPLDQPLDLLVSANNMLYLHVVKPMILCLQRFDTVCWAPRRASGLSDEVSVWLSVWSEVQIVCIWSMQLMLLPSPSSLASFKYTLVLPFWYWLQQFWCGSQLGGEFWSESRNGSKTKYLSYPYPSYEVK